MIDLHVITPLTRPQNLPRIAADLKMFHPYFNVVWHVVPSDEKHPEWWGGWERNIVLNSLPENALTWCLDDDNTVHPDFPQALYEAVYNGHPTTAGFLFQREGQASLTLPPTLGQVDMAQFVFYANLHPAIRFKPAYEADFLFIKDHYDTFNDTEVVDIEVINKPCVRYNALRPTEVFDPHPLGNWRTDHMAYMDLRHLRWLYDTLASGRFRRTLEIGVFDGWSSTAFLAACQKGYVDEVHFCDPEPQPHFWELVESFNLGDKVKVHRAKSVDLLAARGVFDLVFVDGDHTRGNVEAESRLLIDAKVNAIFAHDTNAAGKYPNCEGPQFLKQSFQVAGYYGLEDCIQRENERTERGMYFAARHLADYQVAMRTYGKNC